nr:MAG: zinc-dependent metalloprotease [Diabrotica toursvirus 3a]
MEENKILMWKLENFPSNVNKQVVEDLLEKAFDVWKYYINVNFIKATDRDRANIMIKFHKKKDKICATPFDGKHGILAHATLPSYTDSLVIHFDEEEHWDFTNKNTIKNVLGCQPLFFNVAVHEIGHLLGLTHNRQINSVMNEHYSRFIDKPSFEDIVKLQSRFGIKNQPPINDLYIKYFVKVYYKETIICVICVILLLLFSIKKKN